MSQRVVYASDLSGKDIPDGDKVEVRVLELEGLSMPVKLDASKTEVDRLRVESSSLALLELVMPDGETVRVAIPAEQFKKSIKGDADEVLANAEGLSFAAPAEAETPRRRGRRSRGESAASGGSGEKINYASLEHAGTPHRGRVTEAEAQIVRDNLDEINERLVREGRAAIDPTDQKMKDRYGL